MVYEQIVPFIKDKGNYEDFVNQMLPPFQDAELENYLKTDPKPWYVLNPDSKFFVYFAYPLFSIVLGVSFFLIPFTYGVGAKEVLDITRSYELAIDGVLLVFTPMFLLTATYNDANEFNWTWWGSLQRNGL